LSKRIGIGTVQFGIKYGISNTFGQTPEAEVSEILNYAKLVGINLLDTASSYGNAEAVLGKSNLSAFQIVSKYLSNGEKVEKHLQQSLNNLRIEKLYGYLLHRPSDLLEFPHEWKELKQVQDRGLVQKIGFSLYQPSELVHLMDKGFTPDIIQVPYNYFDRRFEPYFEQLNNNGIEIHTRSSFLQGLFFKKPDDLSQFFDSIKPILKGLHSFGDSLASELLGFSLSNSCISKVIIGVENKFQLIRNLSDLRDFNSLPKLNIQIPEPILLPSSWPK
jgi:aryl-alcohol dehydrogenase-like predicted oxidoreductase